MVELDKQNSVKGKLKNPDERSIFRVLDEGKAKEIVREYSNKEKVKIMSFFGPKTKKYMTNLIKQSKPKPVLEDVKK